MRSVVLTTLAALVLVAFTFSGCKKSQPVTPKTPAGQAGTKTTPGQPTTVAPEKSTTTPGTTQEKQAAPAPTAPQQTPAPAPAEKPATNK